MKMRSFSFLVLVVLSLSAGAEIRLPARGVVDDHPAKDWQHALLTGNGTIGAMVNGELNRETVSLSHCRLYLPNSDQPTYTDRDPFMGACALKIATDVRDVTAYRRMTDFETGVCAVAAETKRGDYLRRVVALREENLIAIAVTSASRRVTHVAIDGLPLADRRDLEMFEKGVKEIVNTHRDGFGFYRCTYRETNPWNPVIGYEVVGRFNETSGEGFYAVEPILKGQTSNFDALAERIRVAERTGFETLLKRHAVRQRELMNRVFFTLDGAGGAAGRPYYGTTPSSTLTDRAWKGEVSAELVALAFDAGRYNIISSVGGAHIPNLQGLWSGTWSAPWFASFTVNGNLPCAISFFDRGNTPEFNENLLAWMEERLPECRTEAQRRYGARGFRFAAQTTVSGRETDFNANYPHHHWHGGAWWLVSRLYDGYLHTLDRKWLERIYPLMRDCANYYTDVLKPMTDGTLGFDPSYSPENWPSGKRPTSVNATMDNAEAKQCFRWTIAAAQTLGVDAEACAGWAKTLARLTPFAVSPKGYFAEWLAPGQADNNEHRHASHLYALYDEANEEIVSNPELVAAVGRTIDARMDFNENRSRTMAFGYVQNGLAACRIRDGERAFRALTLLTRRNWMDGLGSCHDWRNCFNTDISGGYPYLISNMLIDSDGQTITYLPARPKAWRKGRIGGLLLRGNVLVKELSWTDDDYVAHLRLADGSEKTVTGTAK